MNPELNLIGNAGKLKSKLKILFFFLYSLSIVIFILDYFLFLYYQNSFTLQIYKLPIFLIILSGISLAIGTLALHSKSKNPLLNQNRYLLYNQILNQPGIHFSGLVKNLHLSNGQIQWYIRILENNRLIIKKKQGQYLLFFPYFKKSYNLNDVELKYVIKNDIQRKILKKIQDSPGLNQKDLKQKLNLSQSKVAYHLHKLIVLEFIDFKISGKSKIYYIKKENKDIMNKDDTSLKT